jgi:hypothetical protein
MGTSFAAYHDRRGAVIGPLGYPVSMARPAGASPAGSTGAFQRFEGSRDLPRDVLDLWAQLKMESRGGCTVYESDRGIYTVASAIAAFYERLGGTTSWLGFPLTEEHDDPTLSSEEWCRSQRFEGGVVFRTGNHRAVAVSAHVMQVLGEGESSLLRRLGRPQSPETSTDLAGLTLQLFANGVVTIKDGTPQVWVRP